MLKISSENPRVSLTYVATPAAAIRPAALHGLPTAILKSYRGGSFRVVPRTLRHTPCVMTSLTGLLESQTAADNESNHDNDSE